MRIFISCKFFTRSLLQNFIGNTRNYLKLKNIVLTSLTKIKWVELIQHRIHKLIWLKEVQFNQQYGTIRNSVRWAASLLLFSPPGSVKFRKFTFYGNKYFVNWVKNVLCQFESAIVNSNISILHKEILQKFMKTATITWTWHFWQHLVLTFTFSHHTLPLVMAVKNVSDLSDIRFSHGAKMVITSSDSKRFILIYNCFFVWKYVYLVTKNKV